MKTFIVKIDNNPAYKESANLYSEILDNAEPNHSHSVMTIEFQDGHKTAFYWNNSEYEWFVDVSIRVAQ